MKRGCALPADARCFDCGYLLRGLGEHRCPECGRRFDPSDADSCRSPATHQPWASKVRPPSPATVWLHGTVTLAGVAALSEPMALWNDRDEYDVITFPAHFVLVFVAYMACRVWFGYAYACRQDSERLSQWRAMRSRMIASTLIGAFALLAFWYAWPVMLRLALTTPLLWEAPRIVADGADLTGPRWFGTVQVERVFGPSRGFAFFQTSWKSGTRHGLLYDPSDRVKRRGRRIWWNWYLDAWDG